MARKRKIPARKHHGVRDPLKQLEEREKKLKNVVNNPPAKGDDTQESFKFTQFKKLADAAKAGKKIKRKCHGQEDKPKLKTNKKTGAASGYAKSYKSIKQFQDETDEDYLKRVNRITSESLREAQYEAKYGVNVVRDPKTGTISVEKRPKNEIDELLKQKEKERRYGGTSRSKRKDVKTSQLMDTKTAKELIKQAFREDKEEKKKESTDQQEYKLDYVRFGEVVHAPPAILSLPRKAQKNETVPRPGKKANLLLKSLLDGPDSKLCPSNTPLNKINSKSKPVSKKQLRGKRRDLPAATRSMLENERTKYIELYRKLKLSKEKNLK